MQLLFSGLDGVGGPLTAAATGFLLQEAGLKRGQHKEGRASAKAPAACRSQSPDITEALISSTYHLIP